MAFFSREARPADEDQLSMLSALAGQIGQFMDRKRVELGLRLAHAELESNVEKRTRQLTETNVSCSRRSPSASACSAS